MNPPAAVEGLRILVLDHGDIRAFSQLEILEQLLYRANWENRQEGSDVDLPPCDYFHLIVGSGTGAVLALFFVIFKMTVPDAKEAFYRLYETIFADARSSRTNRTQLLTEEIKKLLRKYGKDPEMRLLGDQSDCIGFVCASPSTNEQHCRRLRTYRCQEPPSNISVVEAIRASWGAPIFDPVIVGQSEFAEEYGGTGFIFNNPIREAIAEAASHYPVASTVSLLISLGCGRPPISTRTNAESTSLSDPMDRILAENDRVATEIERTISMNQGYYRFSVERGLESIPSPPRIAVRIIEITQYYLREERVQRELEDCLRAGRRAGQLTTRELARWKTKPRSNNHGLPALSAFFVVRRRELDALNEGIFGGYFSGPRIAVVSGMGGVGKTQLILHFALQNADRFKHVFFIDGSSIQTVMNNMVRRVRALGHTCRTVYDALQILGQWDEQTDGRYLIIFDNVDDRSVSIANYFPQSERACIIISTRNHALGSLAPQAHLELGEMSANEAIEALLKVILPPGQRATDEQADIAFTIADELGYFPVALVQAGGYIRERRCLGDYLNRLKRSHQRVLTHPLPEQRDKYQTNLYASLDLTSQELSPRAQQYLHLFSFGHHRNFPLALVDLAAKHHFLLDPVDLLDRDDEFRRTTTLLHDIFCPSGEWVDDDFDDVLVELQRVSLVTLSEDGDQTRVLSMHPLVRTWARDRLPEKEIVAYRNAIARLLSCGSGREGVKLHEHLIPHIRALSANWEDLHVNDRASFADLLAAPGIADDCVQIWESVHRATLKAHGEVSNQTLEVLKRLKLAYQTQGDEKRAMYMQQEIAKLDLVLAQMDRRRPIASDRSGSDFWNRNHPASTWNTSSYRHLVPQSPTPRYSQVEHLQTPGAGPSSPRGSIALVQTYQGRDTASFLAEKELAMRYQQEEQYTEAARVGESLLTYGREQLGPLHGYTLWAQEFVAEMYEMAGQPEQATNHRSTILSQLLRDHGKTDPRTLDALSKLAANYEARKCYREAAKFLATLLQYQQRVKGADQSVEHDTLGRLAEALEMNGQFDQATPFRENLLREARATNNLTNIRVAARKLANNYENRRPIEEAVRLLKEKLSLGYNASDDLSLLPWIIFSEALAAVYEQSGRLEDAITLRVKILELQSTKDRFSEETRVAQSALAQVYEALKRYDKAEVLRRAVVDSYQRQQVLPEYTDATLTAIHQLARNLGLQGKYDELVDIWIPIETDTRLHCGPDHPHTLWATKELAKAYELRKQFVLAEPLWKCLLHQVAPRGAPKLEDKSTVDISQRLVRNLRIQGRDEEALAFAEMYNVGSHSLHLHTPGSATSANSHQNHRQDSSSGNLPTPSLGSVPEHSNDYVEVTTPASALATPSLSESPSDSGSGGFARRFTSLFSRMKLKSKRSKQSSGTAAPP